MTVLNAKDKLPGNLFPARPMKTSRSVFVGGLASLIWALALVVAGVFFLNSLVPGVWRDIQINHNPTKISNFNMTRGECTTHYAVFTNCHVDFSYPNAGEMVNSNVGFFFIAPTSSNGYDVGVVVSATQPELATLDLALDKLWNRVAMIVVLLLAVLGFVVGIFVILRRLLVTMADNKRARQGGIVTPVELEVTGTEVKFYKAITYKKVGEAKGRSVTARLGKSDELIWLDERDGKSYALGAQIEGVTSPLVLNTGLSVLDFTEQERIAFHSMLSPDETPLQSCPAAS